MVPEFQTLVLRTGRIFGLGNVSRFGLAGELQPPSLALFKIFRNQKTPDRETGSSPERDEFVTSKCR